MRKFRAKRLGRKHGKDPALLLTLSELRDTALRDTPALDPQLSPQERARLCTWQQRLAK